MRFDWKLLAVLLIGLGLFWGCEESKEPEATSFEILSEYMLDHDLDAPVVISAWTIHDTLVAGHEQDYYILDIRGADAYNVAHIPTAVNSAVADVLTTVENGNTTDLPVVVVCYSGQTAGHVVMALRLSGVAPDARVLLFGMCAWGPSYDDSWENNIGNAGTESSNWSEDDATTIPDGFDDPVITTEFTDGAAILNERVELLLTTNGFSANAVSNTTVLAAPENYQIFNYWGATDYNNYGHITGAMQLTPGSLSIADGLDILDPNMQNVIYCWTGQTSSMLAAWLNVLGYDALTLKFGANGMIYDRLAAHKWSARSADYSTEP